MDQADKNQQKTEKILLLYEDMKNRIVDLTHSQYSIHTLDFIFSRLIFKSTDFTGGDEIPTPTAKRILAVLREKQIITTLREASGRKSAIYFFNELLDITETET